MCKQFCLLFGRYWCCWSGNHLWFMKIIYMKQTFDILDPETVKKLMLIGKVKKTESGEKYLLVEETQEK
jgi:hypothetical protein